MSKPRKKLIVKVGRFDFAQRAEAGSKRPSFFHLLHYDCAAAPQLSQLVRDATALIFPHWHPLGSGTPLFSPGDRASSSASQEPGHVNTPYPIGSQHQLSVTPPTFDQGLNSSSMRSADLCCAYVDQAADLVFMRDSTDWLAFLLSEAPRFKESVVAKVVLLTRSELQANGISLPAPIPPSPGSTPTAPTFFAQLAPSTSTSDAEHKTNASIREKMPPMERSVSEPPAQLKAPGLTTVIGPPPTPPQIPRRRRNSILSEATTSSPSDIGKQHQYTSSEGSKASTSPLSRIKSLRESCLANSPPNASSMLPSSAPSSWAGEGSHGPSRPLRKGASTTSLRTQARLAAATAVAGQREAEVSNGSLGAKGAPLRAFMSFADAEQTDLSIGLALTTEPIESMNTPTTLSDAEGECDPPTMKSSSMIAIATGGPGTPHNVRRIPSVASPLGFGSGVPPTPTLGTAQDEDESILFWGMNDAEADGGSSVLKIRTWQYQWPAPVGEATDEAAQVRIRAAFVPSRRLAQQNKVMLARAATRESNMGNPVGATAAEVPNMQDLLELPYRCFSSADRAYILHQWTRPSFHQSPSIPPTPTTATVMTPNSASASASSSSFQSQQQQQHGSHSSSPSHSHSRSQSTTHSSHSSPTSHHSSIPVPSLPPPKQQQQQQQQQHELSTRASTSSLSMSMSRSRSNSAIPVLDANNHHHAAAAAADPSLQLRIRELREIEEMRKRHARNASHAVRGSGAGAGAGAAAHGGRGM